MVVIKDFEMPESCLMCTKRKCLHIDGKAYQMCGLNEDGYLRESWFNSENIPKDYRSEHCPLKEVEAITKDQYEQRLKENNELINDLEELRTMINKFAESYENRLKADLMAMLKEIQIQAEENIENIYEKDEDNILMLSQHNAFADCFEQFNDLIQEKIDALKAENKMN